MSLTDQQQDLYNILKSTLPRFCFANESAQLEYFNALTMMFDKVLTQINYWKSQAFIESAESYWLDQHAIDRGTGRQGTADGNETDDHLRSRLRNFQDLVTPVAILVIVNSFMDGVLSTIDSSDLSNSVKTLVELRRDKAFFQTYTGADVDADNDPLNVGSVNVTVPGAETSVLYASGKQMAYFDRGYRMSSTRGGFIVILPYGTPNTIVATITEALRNARAAGFPAIVETRMSP